MVYRSLLVILVLAASLCGAVAGETPKFSLDGRLSHIKFGTHLRGPQRTPEELEDHVVLVYYWSMGCGIVEASIPIVQRWHQQYERQGLIVIGMNTDEQDRRKQEVFLKKKGVTYTMQNGGDVMIRDGITIMLPHVFLFDYTGSCVFRGRADHGEAKDALRDTMNRAPAPPFAKIKLARLQRLSDWMKAGRPPHSVFGEATKLSAHEDEQITAEASLVMEALKNFGQKKLDLAAGVKEAEPQKYLEALAAIARDFRGMGAGETARDTIAELRKDKAFVKELRACQMLEKLKKLESRLRPIRTANGPDTTSELFRSKNAGTLRTISSGIRAMRAKFPGSNAIAGAEELGRKYGILLAD